MGAPCKGDSGGPLYQFDALGNVVLIGVVSFGMNCGSAGVPGVYVRISHFISWLRRLNVPFRTGDPVVSYFDTGSREAASETPAVVGGELTVNDGNIVVSKVWFVVICVIAGIAVIALIFISLLFVSGFGSSGRRGEEVQEGDVDRDSLHAAISILQGLVEEHSSRDGADTIHDGEYDGEQSRANVVEENRNV